jgi:hypothetical protein
MRILKFNESKDKYLNYYAFDWDDNILFMPTEIIVIDENGEEVGIPTSEFAKYRKHLIEENPVKYKGRTIVGFPKNGKGENDFNRAYSNFRDYDPDVFINDIKKALYTKSFGPAYSDFIECLVHGSLFAIITARGHEKTTLRRGVEYFIENQLSEDQKTTMYNHLLRYAYIFKTGEYDRIPRGKFTQTLLVKEYLDNCDFVGISAPSRGGTPDNPEKEKEKALLEFKDKVNRFAHNVGMEARIGFSDDDVGNVKHVEELFKNIDHEKYSNIKQYIVKNTNNPKKISKMNKTVESIKKFDEFLTESDDTDKGMYVDVETDKEAIKSNKKELTVMGEGKNKSKKKDKKDKK